MRLGLEVQRARRLAEELLADALPQRWIHTIWVADKATRLARVLAPEWADEIVAAAWLHEIGYAPELVDTGFHPIDGAAHLVSRTQFSRSLACLVAHHTGAQFEAQERALQDQLGRYPVPADAASLAILSCADLCTGPDGASMDPADRIAEVLTRYLSDHPVHRAVTKSAPLLVEQARLVLGAAEAARHGAPPVSLPERVECLESGVQWRAVWSSDYHRVTACSVAAGMAVDRGVEISLTNPPPKWDPDDAAGFAQDLRAATDAAAGKALCWNQYRAFSAVVIDGDPHRSTDECVLTPWGSTTTFYFDDIVRLHLDMAAQGRSVHVQQRTFKTLSDVTDCIDVAHVMIGGPPDLLGLKQIPALDVTLRRCEVPNREGEQPL